jgi:hypothetical protein
MWWLHIKFTLAVVLFTVVLVAMYPLALLADRKSSIPTVKEIRDGYVSLRDDVYFR